MKTKRLIGVAFVVLALALVGATVTSAAPSDGNASALVAGNLTGEEGLVTSTSSAILDPSAIIPDAPSNGVVMVEAHAPAADGTIIDPSDMSAGEGSGMIIVSSQAGILDASGNAVDVPLSGGLVLGGSAAIETLPPK